MRKKNAMYRSCHCAVVTVGRSAVYIVQFDKLGCYYGCVIIVYTKVHWVAKQLLQYVVTTCTLRRTAVV